MVASDGYMYKNNIENKDAIMISQAWTKVNLSTTHKDKKVYGVISDYAERVSGSDMLVVTLVRVVFGYVMQVVVLKMVII